MNRIGRIRGWLTGALLAAAAGLAVPMECRAAFEATIDVAPATLNLQSEGSIVTVHTDLPYSTVVAYSVTLNDVEIQSWKADSRGFFVAKFPILEIKGLPHLAIGAYNEFKLVGATTGGEAFWGVDQVMVLDIIPAGRK